MNDDTAAVHDLAAVYALDALPPDEADVFEAHLATCASCQQEVAELRDVASDLASLSSAPPPDDLRAAVMGAIDDVEQVSPPAAPAAPDQGPDAVVSIRPDATDPATASGDPGVVVSLAEHRRSRRVARIATGVAAVLVLVAGALGLWASDLDRQVDQLTGQVGDLDQQLVALGDQQ